MRNAKHAAVAAVALALTAGLASASTVSIQMGDGSAGAGGAKDTWIVMGPASGINGANTSDTNSGLDNKIRTRPYSTSNGERMGLFAFPGLIGSGASQVPANATINSATLLLTLSHLTAAGAPSQSTASINLAAYQMTDDWDEGNGNWTVVGGSITGATWNNAKTGATNVPWSTAWAVTNTSNRNPAGITGPIGPELSKGVAVTIGVRPSEQWDVTSAVQHWADGSPNYGLALFQTAWDNAEFWSRESTGMNGGSISWNPVLMVDYTAVPEPTCLGFLAVGGMLMLKRRS